MLKSIAVVLTVFGIACAYPQILIPSGLSYQSGIIRNIPTTIVGVPISNALLSERDRAIITQLQIEQLINNRLNNNINNNRDIRDQINREIAIQSQNRINNQLNEQNRAEQIIKNEQIRAEQVIRNDQTRNEQIRNVQLDRAEVTRQVLEVTGTGLNNSQLRNGRFV